MTDTKEHTQHEPQPGDHLPFSELKSGDRFRFVGHPELCAKVHQKYIKVGKIGGYSIPEYTLVELVSRFKKREPKEVEF